MSENKPPESDSLSAPGNLSAPSQKEHSKTLEEIIQEKAPEVLDAIPVSERPKLAKITIAKTSISYRSGILPEASELAAYDAIIPDGADRIMKMAEAQSAHRMELERIVVVSQQGHEKRGQWFGLIIAVFFASCGLYAAIHGEQTFGTIIAGTTLVSIVGLFVYAKHQVKKELVNKREGMTANLPQKAPSKKSPEEPRKSSSTPV